MMFAKPVYKLFIKAVSPFSSAGIKGKGNNRLLGIKTGSDPWNVLSSELGSVLGKERMRGQFTPAETTDQIHVKR